METKINVTETATPKKIKTLANCTSKEFLVQTGKIAQKVNKYAGKIKEYMDNLTESGEEVSKIGNALEILSFICGGNIDDTMELCGDICFMSGDEFASLDPTNGDPDGISAIVDMFKSERCIGFFMSALSIGKLTKVL